MYAYPKIQPAILWTHAKGMTYSHFILAFLLPSVSSHFSRDIRAIAPVKSHVDSIDSIGELVEELSLVRNPWSAIHIYLNF